MSFELVQISSDNPGLGDVNLVSKAKYPNYFCQIIGSVLIGLGYFADRIATLPTLLIASKGVNYSVFLPIMTFLPSQIYSNKFETQAFSTKTLIE
jgi:hypothetical protein